MTPNDLICGLEIPAYNPMTAQEFENAARLLASIPADLFEFAIEELDPPANLSLLKAMAMGLALERQRLERRAKRRRGTA